MIKKMVVLAVAAAGAVVVRRKMEDGKAEQSLWAEATDSVKRS